jgi:adenylosuccinate synthase
MAHSAMLRESGGEYGATTGRPCRCGWFDANAAYGRRQRHHVAMITKLTSSRA